MSIDDIGAPKLRSRTESKGQVGCCRTVPDKHQTDTPSAKRSLVGVLACVIARVNLSVARRHSSCAHRRLRRSNRLTYREARRASSSAMFRRRLFGCRTSSLTAPRCATSRPAARATAPWLTRPEVLGLEGQSAVYIKSQLEAFASGERRNDISEEMRNVAQAMTPEEIEEASQYYASQPSPDVR